MCLLYYKTLAVHCSTLVLYIFIGSNTITPDIYYWGLGNYILFSIFGLLIGNAINKERFERYVYAEHEKELADMRMRYAYYDRMTGFKNRHAFEDKLLELAKAMPSEFCIIMIDSLEKAQRCLSDLNDLMSKRSGKYIDSISVSTGAASIKNHDNIASVFAEADKKMYDCKHNYYLSRGID